MPSGPLYANYVHPLTLTLTLALAFPVACILQLASSSLQGVVTCSLSTLLYPMRVYSTCTMYMYIYLLASMQKYYKRYMYVPGAYETHLASRSYDPIHVYTLVLVLFAVINFTL